MNTEDQNKQPVSFRIRPRLIADIDAVIDQTPFETRTDFIEEALVMYLEYIEQQLQGL
jgi:hypothetical protein